MNAVVTSQCNKLIIHCNYRKTTEFLNNSQTVVITADQPLYARLKELQIFFPEKYKKFFFVLGPLHIEMVKKFTCDIKIFHWSKCHSISANAS